MSDDKDINAVGSIVVYKSPGDHNTFTVNNNTQVNDLDRLVDSLTEALLPARQARPDDADRVSRAAQEVIAETRRAKPSRDYLQLTAEGLKKAAEAVKDIAPGVLDVARQVAEFVVKSYGM